MRRFAPLPGLFVYAAALALVAAEPAREAAQTDCEPKRRSCVAECRARYFSVDPKRAACIADCEAEANRCARKQPARSGEFANPATFRGIFPESEGATGAAEPARPAGP